MDKMGHQSATIFPEQLELIRMWLRSCLNAYEESDYAKNTTVPHRGELDTSGFSDYLWFTAQFLAIDIGPKGGHRTGCYAKMASTNFEVVAEAVGKRPFGMWNADVFVKKCSGRGFKRAPHLIFDRGVNRGVVRRFKLLTDPSRRKPEWDKGIVGTGSDAKPGNGIRLFLQPLGKVQVGDQLWFKNIGIGKHHLQPLQLLAPVILEIYGASCGMSLGVD